MRLFERRARLVAAYHTVFDSESGKIVLADLVRTHGVMLPIYINAAADGSGQSLGIAHAEGQRAVVLRIIHELDISLEDIINQAREEERLGRLNTDET